MWSPYKLTTMRYRVFGTRFKRIHKSNYSMVPNCFTWSRCVYNNISLSDRMTPRSVQQLFNGLDPTNPALSVAGSVHPITSKNQSRSNRGTQGCHIMSWDLMFNAEILHHGRDVNQRPIWTGPSAGVRFDTRCSPPKKNERFMQEMALKIPFWSRDLQLSNSEPGCRVSALCLFFVK